MFIKTVEIRRYRAIDQKSSISLRPLSVLTGPNNLGKSTVLSALDLFFSVFNSDRSSAQGRATIYRYDNDYPKKYKGKAGRRWPTQIRVTFGLSDDDCGAMFAGQNTIAIINELSATVEFEWQNNFQGYRPKISVNIDSNEVGAAFINWLRQHVRYVYIPAARNVQDFKRGAFSELIEGALARVSKSRQRLDALQRLHDDIKKEISIVEAEVVEQLRQYLPDVKKITFVVNELDIENLVSVREAYIDDGAETTLLQKGDGFKSLFSISLMQYLARQRFGKNLIFAIEEPEAHLHSSAIYEIKTTLRELSKLFQVLITTHSPILLQRDDIEANIIVEREETAEFSTKTRPAQSLGELRKSLGIRAHENMTTAEVVIVVEGLTEERVLPAILAACDDTVGGAFSSGRVRVLGAGGASNVLATVRALARDATSCVALLDDDVEGKSAAERIRASGFVSSNDLFHVPSREGCRESEFEDLFEPKVYIDRLNTDFALHLTAADFEAHRKRSGDRTTRCAKWSGVMERVVNERGLTWDDISSDCKTAVAEAIATAVRSGEIEISPIFKSMSARTKFYLSQQ